MADASPTPDRLPSRMDSAVDAWSNEGGAPPPPLSEPLAAQVATLPPLERKVMQCLGAAVVLAWNELPTDVQRTLFKLASTTEDDEAARELPTRIARFLHDHKDDGGRHQVRASQTG